MAEENAHLSEINDFYLLINAVVAGAETNVIDASDSLNVINMRCIHTHTHIYIYSSCV